MSERVHPLTRASGGLAAVLGLMVLLGWPEPRAAPMPMQLPTALALVLDGLALALLDIRFSSIPRLLGVSAIAVGTASLAGQLLPPSLGIQRLLQQILEGAATTDDGTWQPPLAAVAVVLVGTAVVIRTFWSALHRPSVWLGLLGTATIGLGLLPLLGHLAGIEQPYAAPGFKDIALQAAGGLLLLGTGLLADAGTLARLEHGARPSPWLPVSAAAGILLLAVLLWQALEAREDTQFARNVRIEARTIRSDIASELMAEIDILAQMAARLEERQEPPGPAWRVAAALLADQQRYLGFAWLDDTLEVAQIVPLEGSQDFLGRRLAQDPAQRRAMLTALEEQQPAFSPPFPYRGGQGLYVYAPVYWGEQFAGFMLAAIDVQSLAQHMLRREPGKGHGIALLDSGRVIYRSDPAPTTGRFLIRLPLETHGLSWQVAVWPLPGLRQLNGTLLPEVVFGTGMLLAYLLGLALRAKQLLEHSAGRVRELNADLERRVAQRTAELVASNRELEREAAEREKVAQELAHLATHDPLTGLPNRILFEEHLQRAIGHSARSRQPLAVLFLDLDNFKDINDTLGHATGDLLLRLFAERLRTALRDADMICRQGGDEFLILAEDLPHTYDSIAIAEKILDALTQGFQLGDSEVYVSTSIGIATYPDSGEDTQTLIKHADSAMYQAKAEGRNTFALYSTRLHRLALRRLDMKRNLHLALDRDEFMVHYQPQVDLRSGRIVGAEALLRWRRGERMIPPLDFIPLTEETGLIVPIGALVIQRVCGDLALWQRRGLPLPQLSVNVSAAQFRNDRLLHDLRTYAGSAIARHLELELTERVFIEDSEAHRRLLQQVEDMGIGISIDDFGTGCSSFSYFRYFPIHTVKIDQSFIQNVTYNSADAKITETVLDLAQNFQLKVIAEGVETAGQMEFLRKRQCDEAQGYYFSRPIPHDEFLALWQQQTPH